jgi:hypothetical protein
LRIMLLCAHFVCCFGAKPWKLKAGVISYRRRRHPHPLIAIAPGGWIAASDWRSHRPSE